MATERSGTARQGLALDQPILLIGIVFTALVGLAIFTVTFVIGKESAPGLVELINSFRCLLMGPMA
jgi:hypothetical protein